MTDPAITAAIDKLIATTPPPVTVWGVRYATGGIQWLHSEAAALGWLVDERAAGYSVELACITGHVHVEADR